MLTTTDNPYDPFTQYDEWDAYDRDKGYNTCAYIDRVAIAYTGNNIEDETAAYESAIEEILDLNVTGNYIKVSDEDT
jgi:hypothetical protein